MSLTLLVLAVGVLACLGIATRLGVAWIEQRHPPQGIFVAAAMGRLHVVELWPSVETPAERPPVVLLHGASGNLEEMRVAFGDALLRRHRVILIDRPGHGWSDRPDGDADAAPLRQAASIVEALDLLGVTRAIFVGHSWGGALAAAVALAFPDRVAGLVLLAPVTHPWPGGIPWYYDLAASRVLGPLFAHTIVLPLGALMLGPGSRGVFAPQPVPVNYVGRAAIALVLRPRVFLANARDVARLKANVAAQAPHYPKITAPVVIITGDHDRTVSPTTHAMALASAVPHAKLILLPGIGHMLHHAAPDLILAEIDRMVENASLAAAQ